MHIKTQRLLLDQ